MDPFQLFMLGFGSRFDLIKGFNPDPQLRAASRSGSATAALFLDNVVAEKGNFVTIDLSVKLLLSSSVKLFTQFYHDS